MRKSVIIGGIAAAILAAGAAVALPLVLSGADTETVIRIPANASARNVSDSLSKYLGPSYASKVMRVARLRGSDFSSRHGAYLIPAGTSPLRAERKLSQGAQQPLTVTINGFRTLANLASKVSNRLDFTPDSLLNSLNNPAVLKKYNLSPRQSLALFVDDSYQFYWSASPDELIKKIGDNYLNIWNADRTAKAKALGLTPAEVMTICSIVDEETNKADEKGAIGRLYINRLKKGMPLQADPTVRYALQDFTIRRVKGEHLKTDSPYNTYRNKGLPPGPIRTTSLRTIDSVLNSSPSDYIYMCAKEDFSGYHNFAATYDVHMANARRYQKALNERNIH